MDSKYTLRIIISAKFAFKNAYCIQIKIRYYNRTREKLFFLPGSRQAKILYNLHASMDFKKRKYQRMVLNYFLIKSPTIYYQINGLFLNLCSCCIYLYFMKQV